ncbi:GtrA family protein [Paraburkholderia sp. D15]|uniref:GtrA family protein n=1 Tax=Paraburkholderia sp. D15 TaxID=2880218 RepID=UPI00247A635F|nr:GtrA family protein [Paraburkholderia sp. D15]WGS54150.1 GtrA family protein [Paraburkholderia sp. D15]
MQTSKQLARFVAVGIASNAILYVLYLAATSIGIGHKVAMTALFALGIVQTFVFNKKWSFQHSGSNGSAFIRYLGAYCAAYCINLAAMMIFVDRYHISDRLVQAVMIVVVAAFMFVAQRLWVFPASSRSFAEQE